MRSPCSTTGPVPLTNFLIFSPLDVVKESYNMTQFVRPKHSRQQTTRTSTDSRDGWSLPSDSVVTIEKDSRCTSELAVAQTGFSDSLGQQARGITPVSLPQFGKIRSWNYVLIGEEASKVLVVLWCGGAWGEVNPPSLTAPQRYGRAPSLKAAFLQILESPRSGSESIPGVCWWLNRANSRIVG